MIFGHKSSFLDELFFDRAGDAQVYFQYLCHQHLNHLILVLIEILLDLLDVFSSLLLQSGLKLLIFFLT